MHAQLINGKAIAATMRANLRQTIQQNLSQGKKPPTLAVILVGNDPASEIYVHHKRIACEEVGIHSQYFHLPNNIPEQQLIHHIQLLNNDHNVDGILVQLPLPQHIHSDNIIECINPIKDVDGFHAYNLGRLVQRRPVLAPCTPQGVMILLNSIQQPYKNKHAVIIGASNIVGRPMALELLIAGATITVCHRFTQDLSFFVKQADILISAVGKPSLIKGNWIKEGATVIDIGITRLENGNLVGDVEFEIAKARAAWITPVPGGAGPMTVAVLLQNTLIAANLVARESKNNEVHN